MNALNTALTTIRRSPYQAVIAVIMTTLTFFVGFLLSLLILGTNIALRHIESQPQIIGFFELGTTQSEIDAVKTRYEQMPEVSSATVVTQEQALDIYRKENSDDPLLLELVTADILPASIEVKAHNLADLDPIRIQLEKEPSMEEVVFQQDVINTLKNWTSGIRTGGVIAATILSIVSFLSIMVVIALKATNQKTTISIFRLLGASPGFVKLPFIVEGILYGVFGCLIGWVLSFIASAFAFPQLQQYLGDLLPTSIPIVVLLAQLGVGLIASAILGAVAGFAAVSRLMRL